MTNVKEQHRQQRRSERNMHNQKKPIVHPPHPSKRRRAHYREHNDPKQAEKHIPTSDALAQHAGEDKVVQVQRGVGVEERCQNAGEELVLAVEAGPGDAC